MHAPDQHTERRSFLTKDELINAVIKTCKDPDLSKRLTGDILDAAFENISKSIKKDKRFAYPSFGTFTVRSRKARKGRNPQTGEEIKIKASKTVGFKPAPTLKTML
jgi:DNA-binding protein HU-beta